MRFSTFIPKISDARSNQGRKNSFDLSNFDQILESTYFTNDMPLLEGRGPKRIELTEDNKLDDDTTRRLSEFVKFIDNNDAYELLRSMSPMRLRDLINSDSQLLAIYNYMNSSNEKKALKADELNGNITPDYIKTALEKALKQSKKKPIDKEIKNDASSNTQPKSQPTIEINGKLVEDELPEYEDDMDDVDDSESSEEIKTDEVNNSADDSVAEEPEIDDEELEVIEDNNPTEEKAIDNNATNQSDDIEYTEDIEDSDEGLENEEKIISETSEFYTSVNEAISKSQNLNKLLNNSLISLNSASNKFLQIETSNNDLIKESISKSYILCNNFFNKVKTGKYKDGFESDIADGMIGGAKSEFDMLINFITIIISVAESSELSKYTKNVDSIVNTCNAIARRISTLFVHSNLSVNDVKKYLSIKSSNPIYLRTPFIINIKDMIKNIDQSSVNSDAMNSIMDMIGRDEEDYAESVQDIEEKTLNGFALDAIKEAVIDEGDYKLQFMFLSFAVGKLNVSSTPEVLDKIITATQEDSVEVVQRIKSKYIDLVNGYFSTMANYNAEHSIINVDNGFEDIEKFMSFIKDNASMIDKDALMNLDLSNARDIELSREPYWYDDTATALVVLIKGDDSNKEQIAVPKGLFNVAFEKLGKVKGNDPLPSCKMADWFSSAEIYPIGKKTYLCVFGKYMTILPTKTLEFLA